MSAPKMNLAALFHSFDDTAAKEPEQALPDLFDTPSVNGKTPPALGGRIYLDVRANQTYILGASKTRAAVPETLNTFFNQLVDGIKTDSWKFRKVKMGHGRRRRVWEQKAFLAVSSTTRIIFARVYDNTRGNRTIRIGYVPYSTWKELKAVWEAS
jgi:hypothetical protein